MADVTVQEGFLNPLAGVEETLRSIIEPVCQSFDLELIVLQLVRSQSRDVLKLSLDRPHAGVTPGKGISMAELEHMNRLLGDLLDVEDQNRKLFKEQWELEVGSPGVDRPLTRKSHFGDVLGQKLKVRLKLEKRSIVGPLEGADDTGIVVGGERVLFAAIDNAHVIYVFEEKQKPGKTGTSSTKGKKKMPTGAEAMKTLPDDDDNAGRKASKKPKKQASSTAPN